MPMAGVQAVVVRGAQAVRRLRRLNNGVEATDQLDPSDRCDEYDDDWE